MISVIGSVFKYSLLVFVILILSHIVEIQGTTISQHVLNGMHWVSGYNPQRQAHAIKDEFTKAMEARTRELNKVDSEVSADDQKALNRVIENSQRKR